MSEDEDEEEEEKVQMAVSECYVLCSDDDHIYDYICVVGYV